VLSAQALALRGALLRARGDASGALAAFDAALELAAAGGDGGAADDDGADGGGARAARAEVEAGELEEAAGGGLAPAGAHVGAGLWLRWRAAQSELALAQRSHGRCAALLAAGGAEAAAARDAAAAVRLRQLGALLDAQRGEHARAARALDALCDEAATLRLPARARAELCAHAAELELLRGAAAARGAAGAHARAALGRAAEAAALLDAHAAEEGLPRREAWPALEQPAFDQAGGYSCAADGALAVLAVPRLHNLHSPATPLRVRVFLLLGRARALDGDADGACAALEESLFWLAQTHAPRPSTTAAVHGALGALRRRRLVGGGGGTAWGGALPGALSGVAWEAELAADREANDDQAEPTGAAAARPAAAAPALDGGGGASGGALRLSGPAPPAAGPAAFGRWLPAPTDTARAVAVLLASALRETVARGTHDLSLAQALCLEHALLLGARRAPRAARRCFFRLLPRARAC
jgi:hypothetical protein